MTWERQGFSGQSSALLYCQPSLPILPPASTIRVSEGQTDRLRSTCNSLPSPLQALWSRGLWSLYPMVPHRGGALPEPQRGHCPGWAHVVLALSTTLPRLLRLQWFNAWTDSDSSSASSPSGACSGSDTFSQSHVVVKQDICQVFLAIPGAQ